MATGDDRRRFGGGTSAYEAHLERKRAALRHALRKEYIRQSYHPETFQFKPNVIFDSGIQRYMSMFATRGEYISFTWRHYAKFAVMFLLPFSFHFWYIRNEKRELEGQIRSGKMPYDHPDRTTKFFN